MTVEGEQLPDVSPQLEQEVRLTDKSCFFRSLLIDAGDCFVQIGHDDERISESGRTL